MPMEDFDVIFIFDIKLRKISVQINCTCIIITGKPINASDDVYMYFMGYEIPFKYFQQVFFSLSDQK